MVDIDSYKNNQNTLHEGQVNVSAKPENPEKQKIENPEKPKEDQQAEQVSNEIIGEISELSSGTERGIEIKTYSSIQELINAIPDKTDKGRNKEWVQEYINEVKNRIKKTGEDDPRDQDILKELQIPNSLLPITPEKFTIFIKEKRVQSHLEDAIKVDPNNITSLSLQKYLSPNDPNYLSQMMLFSNADIVKAFEEFQKNSHMQSVFKEFTKKYHPEIPVEKLTQASEEVMKEFFTSKWHQEVLVQMMNRQKDEQAEMKKAKEEGKEVKKPEYTAKYMRDNVYYRSIMRLDLQEMEIDKKKALNASQENDENSLNTTEFIQERFEKLKADKEHFANFSRAKTSIVKNTVKENEGDVSAKISTQVEELLNTEIEDKFGKRSYKEILKQEDLINFFGKTIIGAIRTKEGFNGEPKFESETKDGDITDIQLLGYLYGVGKYATLEGQPEPKLELNINMSNEDKEFLAVLRELKIGRDTGESTNNSNIKNSKLFAQMQAAQKRIEQESVKKLAIQQERAKNFRWVKNTLGARHQEESSSNSSTLTSKDNLSQAKGKDIVSGNASINAYLDELQKGESVDSEILEKWRTTGKAKALSGYIARTTGIPFEEVNQNCFRDGILKTNEELISFLKTKNQLSDDQATEIIKGIKEFTPTQVESVIEERSKRYMDTNKEIKESALGWVFDYIKESLNVTVKNATTNTPQNFAESFSFDDTESVKIENGELVIKGKIDGVSTDFYYNLSNGGLFTTPKIGRVGDMYHIHNEHNDHNTENHSNQGRIALVPDFPSFDEITKLTKKGIAKNKTAFEEARKLPFAERGPAMHKILHSSLENNSLLNNVAQNREKIIKQVETDQFMESCFKTFQLQFEGDSVEKTRDKDAFHLLQVLEQSVNSNEDAKIGQQCISLLKELIDIKTTDTNKPDNPETSLQNNTFLNSYFPKNKMETAVSRATQLDSFLSPYNNRKNWWDEKINFTALYEDLNKIKDELKINGWKAFEDIDKLVGHYQEYGYSGDFLALVEKKIWLPPHPDDSPGVKAALDKLNDFYA